MAVPNGILGTWKMTSWKREVAATDETSDWFGPEPIGYVNYGADGRMYSFGIKRDRPTPAGAAPTDPEKVQLFDSMFAYAGTFSVFEDRIVHHLDASWNQAWNGTDQTRFYRLDGDTLVLTTPKLRDPHTGQEAIATISLRRVDARG